MSEARTSITNLAKDATVMRVIGDASKAVANANHNAPTGTEAVPMNPNSSTGARGDVFHSSGHCTESGLKSQFICSDQVLEGRLDDFDHNIPMESSQTGPEAGIHLMGDAFHSNEHADPDPVLTSIHLDCSTNASAECDSNFCNDPIILNEDDFPLVDELYAEIMRDNQLQDTSITSNSPINDSQICANYEIPDLEEMLFNRQ